MKLFFNLEIIDTPTTTEMKKYMMEKTVGHPRKQK